MADRPDTVAGWPVRWEQRGPVTRAVIDQARLPDGFTFEVLLGGESLGHFRWAEGDLDGQPVDVVRDIAMDSASDMLDVRVRAPHG